MDRSEQITQIKAAGGVLFREKKGAIQILLIHRNGFWDLPKGKLEDEESIEECAVREVEEETGADSIEIVSHLCDTYHEYNESSVHYGKTTFWYLMKPSSNESLLQIKPQQEEGITALKWVEAGKAVEMVHFDNLKRVVRAFLGAL